MRNTCLCRRRHSNFCQAASVAHSPAAYDAAGRVNDAMRFVIMGTFRGIVRLPARIITSIMKLVSH